TGCGVPGAPQPPSTGIPKFVGDLKAVRKGDTVTLTWTTPTETGDGELIRKPGKMLLQRALSSGHDAELSFQSISEVPLEPTLKEERGEQATAKDSLTNVWQSAGNADYALYQVMAQNRNGRSFGLPNRVSVPLVLTLKTPQNVKLETVPDGIRIGWDQGWPPNRESHITAQYVWRIMRRLEGANDAVMVRQLTAGNEAMVVVDSTIEWEKNYQYWITPVTLWQDGNRKGEIEGDDSPAASILAHDSFPPAAPSGMQAVYSVVPGQQPFIDVTWTPNTEPDLAGYNVYRHGENGPPVKINNELVKTPRFADPNIQLGAKYFYSVSAVDLRGNESGRSEETSEKAPKE
ncbi:MAG TPA: fibronectin type III domain-containing protein, partial [Candidatus Angelobacter sp.]|nr:fibronectin type III domain-containing protein [Candidatus Angelobacter sp.]